MRNSTPSRLRISATALMVFMARLYRKRLPKGRPLPARVLQCVGERERAGAVMRRGATAVVEALVAAGVRRLFSVSGNQILSLYDATIDRPIDIIHTRHEAAAVHMADAWGRCTEQPGVALVTAGPGHLNALSALYGALMSESPMVLLSGHCGLAQLGQGGFQEMDQAGAARPVTKAAWIARDPERVG